MRLTLSERKTIIETIQKFDSKAQVFLFGSRVDDKKRGGDIDILIVSASIDFLTKSKIRIQLQESLGDQKIDIALYPALNSTDPFFKSIVMEPL